MRLLTWLIRIFIFFTLLAFALNNQHDVAVHWFFGAQWRAPLVIVVLATFASGLALGVLAMVPRWWRQRRLPHHPARIPQGSTATPGPTTLTPPDIAFAQPPREGL
jgi:uncharacterized integral membrane protein